MNPSVYDVFLSHGSPDKPWVATLASELRGLGLEPFFDAAEIAPASSFVADLDRGLASSRFLVLVLSPHSGRPWVDTEWQAFLAQHGPQGRLIPVLLEPTEVPAILAHVQRISALDRDAARVAREIALIAGRPRELKAGDARELVMGEDLVFNLAKEGEELRIVDPVGRARTVTPALAGGQPVRRLQPDLRPAEPRAGHRGSGSRRPGAPRLDARRAPVRASLR